MIVVIAATVGSDGGGGDGGSGGGSTPAGKASSGKESAPRPTPKSYVVQNGDTLTSIARETGVSVDRILRLNPGVDPQILISGERLRLR